MSSPSAMMCHSLRRARSSDSGLLAQKDGALQLVRIDSVYTRPLAISDLLRSAFVLTWFACRRSTSSSYACFDTFSSFASAS